MRYNLRVDSNQGKVINEGIDIAQKKPGSREKRSGLNLATWTDLASQPLKIPEKNKSQDQKGQEGMSGDPKNLNFDRVIRLISKVGIIIRATRA